ncbi:hypothetical protein GOP47_0000746 [Adiantum capillus-veneris]|uniref:High-affinity nitrate transporter n=1 Tax=Adiantum capillus-veneris TaxID=13818 RepID=A0A9D4ZT77_ADICA|nr:hypothetical protein GOP47_0000746 [Adiantum capillus-veneris]
MRRHIATTSLKALYGDKRELASSVGREKHRLAHPILYSFFSCFSWIHHRPNLLAFPDSLLLPFPLFRLPTAEMEVGFHVKIVFLLSAVLLCGQLAHGLTRFSELARALTVEYEAQNGTKAGSGQIKVTWALNTTAVSASAAAAADYKTVDIKLCFGAISQVDRAWRKTNDLLAKDKTCLHNVGSQPFTAAGNSITYTVTKEVPFAYYFIRAYVTNTAKEKIAYGQTSKTDLFTIEPISGRHASIDIAAGVFSAFAVLSLFGFYFAEKKFPKKGNTILGQPQHPTQNDLGFGAELAASKEMVCAGLFGIVSILWLAAGDWQRKREVAGRGVGVASLISIVTKYLEMIGNG